MQTTPGLVSSRGTLRIEGTRSKSVGLMSSSASTRNVGGTGEREAESSVNRSDLEYQTLS